MKYISFGLSILLFSFSHVLIAAGNKPTAAIASAHPLATRAGEEILKQGGNAFDAAVAISAALAVVEPFSSGLGGGGFWLLHQAAKERQIMVDGREVAPIAATKNMYQDSSGQIKKGLSINGPLAAAIPGVPAAIDFISRRYGQLTLEQNLVPAIRYAKEGFEVTERYRKLTGFRLDVLRTYTDAAEIFLHDNDIPPLGHKIVQKDLAETLTKIAIQGAIGFYHGEVARKLVEDVQHHGGIWVLDDLAAYRIIERKPIVTQYHDVRVISASPPSSGGIVLSQALNILENFDLSGFDSITRKHVIIEVMRRAYRDRADFLGDPDFVKVPVKRLLDKIYAEGLADTIELDRATSSEEIGGVLVSENRGTDTTHFSVLDNEGNRVAATLSINLPFGSGFVAKGTGVLLNDEMDDFSSKPLTPNAYGLIGDDANSIAPRKRPLSSMTPTFLETKDHVAILGTPGGSRIISMVLLGILDFTNGKLPRSWVSLPRYHHQYYPDYIQFEQNGLTTIEQTRLRGLGHTLKEKNRAYGNMQAILWYKPRNQTFAASDPRGEGEAIIVY
jgi:gamma-glutamyltranspeptidase/glutathione hydrolase